MTAQQAVRLACMPVRAAAPQQVVQFIVIDCLIHASHLQNVTLVGAE
tara:strand:- start:594 stop:734 length:141 start_codon:yes stop_codon:yes gene_type:complete